MAGPQIRRKPEKPSFWTWVRWVGFFFLIAAVAGKHRGVISWSNGRGVEAEVHCGGGSLGIWCNTTEFPPGSPVRRPELQMTHHLNRPATSEWMGWVLRFQHDGWCVGFGGLFVVVAYLLVCTSAHYWWQRRKSRLLKLHAAPPP